MATTTATKATTEAATTAEAPAAPAERSSVAKGRTTKVGNITRDPELRFAASGTMYAKFGVAVNRPKVRGDWAGEQVTEFYDVTCFKSLAENVAECLHKGDRVIVEGEASLETFTGRDGEKHTSKAITANAVGVELRFATATIHRPERRTPADAVDADGYGEDDEEPF